MPENQYIMCEDDIPIVVPKRLMVFAGHPDDELVSCGGTILKYQELGSEISIVMATQGLGGYAKKEDKQRNNYINRASYINTAIDGIEFANKNRPVRMNCYSPKSDDEHNYYYNFF